MNPYPEVIEKGTLSFSFTGEVITRLARQFWTENNIKRAFTLLCEGLGMKNDQQSLSLIVGNHKLTGVNTLDYVKDKGKCDPHSVVKTKYYEILRQYFWNSIDLYILPRELSKNLNYKREVQKRRDVSGMEQDLLFLIGLLGDEKISFDIKGFIDPIDPTKTIRFPKKMRHYLKGSWLCKHSASVHHNTVMVAFDKFLEICINDTRTRIAMRKAIHMTSSNNDYSSVKGATRENQKVTAPDFLKEMREEAATVIVEKMGGKLGPGRTGWIKPDGTFIECEYSDHITFTKLLYDEGKAPTENAQKLQELGWVKLTASRFWFHDKDKLSKRQLDFIYEFAVKHKMARIQINGFLVTSSNIYKNLSDGNG